MTVFPTARDQQKLEGSLQSAELGMKAISWLMCARFGRYKVPLCTTNPYPLQPQPPPPTSILADGHTSKQKGIIKETRYSCRQ